MNQKPVIYQLTGLGGDQRLFQNLLFEGYEFKYIQYPKAIPGESIAGLAARIVPQIDTTQSFYLMGISLGGIIATELSRLLRPECTILISSAKTVSEFQPAFQWFKIMKLDPLYTPQVQHLYRMFKQWVGKEAPTYMALIDDMFAHADPDFFDWAKAAILDWDNQQAPEKYLHIQGTNDLVFPHQYVQNASLITGGTHIMALDRAPEIIRIIEDHISAK